MRTLNPETVLRVFLCDFRKIGSAERIVEIGEGDVVAFSSGTGGKEKASRRVGAPNRAEGRLILSSLNVGTLEHREYFDRYVSSTVVAHLKRFHSTGLLPPALSLFLRPDLRHHSALVLV
jgi:hypothetical protein